MSERITRQNAGSAPPTGDAHDPISPICLINADHLRHVADYLDHGWTADDFRRVADAADTRNEYKYAPLILDSPEGMTMHKEAREAYEAAVQSIIDERGKGTA